MVLQVFTWPYGGQSVHLYGSFNGWAELVQMIKVEGSGAIFQRALDLLPGCYEYRFLVDDVWQVHKEQPCLQDANGVINNVVFVSGPGISSGGLLQKPITQISSTDIDVLRHHLSMHLSSSTAYDLMPDSSKVLALDASVPIRQAFHFMYEEGLSVLPLWDEGSMKISGMLTASDFILILLHLHINRAAMTNEELDGHTISSWKDIKFQHHGLHGKVTGAPQLNNRRALIQAGPDELLKEVAVKILQNKISAVPVLNSIEEGSNLLSIVSLSGILKYVCGKLSRDLEFLPMLQQPVGCILLGTWARELTNSSGCQLLTLCANEPLGSALNILIQAGISSLPIVDELGTLIDVYCKSDITSLANSSVYAHIQLDRTKILEVLKIVNVTGQTRYQTCTRFDSLVKVMDLLSGPGVRRVIVIDPSSQRVEGIITLTDIFQYILG